MLEVVFLNRNAEKWKLFEKILADRRNADPDRLADLYVELTDDLSYARTFYPKSKTTAYLNNLALQVHGRIYRNKRERLGRIATFFKEEFPMMMYAHRKELLYSLAFTLIGVLVGVVSTLNDMAYVRLILGDGYVNMTLENIKSDDPMGVYKSSALEMFLQIPFHNIMVSLRAFAMGVFLSVGTIFLLFRNGLMLGVFHTLFYQHGLLERSLLSVWLHGTLEITSIVVAGCAGIVFGNSILFPGTYTRMQAFRRGAVDGLKIVVGTIPLLVVAGILESFVTRYTEMPLALNLAIIGVSLAIVIGYLVIYPIHLNRSIDNGDNGTRTP